MSHKPNALLDDFSYLRHEELLARRRLRSCGLGDDLLRRAGVPSRDLANALLAHFDSLADGGLHLLQLATPEGPLRVFCRRRGRMLDAGTRADMDCLGWGAAADELERMAKERGL